MPFSFPRYRETGGCESRRRFFLHRLSGVLELPQACSPLTGGKFFAEPQRGDSPSADGRTLRHPPRGAKRKGHLRFPFLFELLPFPWIVWRRLPTCDRCEKGNGSRVTLAFVSQNIRSSQTTYCYTDQKTSAGRGIAVPRNSLTRYTARHLRIKRLVQFILVGAVYHNALTTCVTLLCRACLDEITCVAVMYLTLRIC